MTFKEQVAPLRGLYKVTGYDWDLTVHHTLTEPTCPSVFIKPFAAKDDKHAPAGERFDCDTLEEGIAAAVAWAKKKFNI